MFKNILILREKKDDYFLQYINYDNIFNIFKENKILNFLSRVNKKLKLNFDFVFFDKWKKNLCNYDLVIIFDSMYSLSLSKYVKKKNPNIKIILWYWNKVLKFNSFGLQDKNIDEIYSYSLEDCRKYNLKYNTQFFSKNVLVKKQKTENGILFLGLNKGRKDKIEKLRIEIEQKKIKCNFIIIEKRKNFIPYSKYLELLSNSAAILDIVTKGVEDPTLRVMEAIFFNKKLISNNKDLLNYDFYDSSRIFILGYDNLDELDNFFKKSYKKLDEAILNKYDFEEWLKRFS